MEPPSWGLLPLQGTDRGHGACAYSRLVRSVSPDPTRSIDGKERGAVQPRRSQETGMPALATRTLEAPPLLRPRYLIAACALALVAFRIPLADAVSAPPSPTVAPHSAPVASSGPTQADRDRALIGALRAAQAQREADEAAWIAAAPKPAPAPKAKKSGSTAAPSVTVAYDPGSIQATICSVFGPYCAKAVQIATCESNLNPSAYNKSGASGLFQLLGHGAMFEAHGWSADDWPDPYKNSVVAFDLSHGGTNWSAWVC